MISRLLIGLLAILYGAIQLGAGISLRIFYWGLIIFGVVWILEHFYAPVRARLVPVNPAP